MEILQTKLALSKKECEFPLLASLDGKLVCSNEYSIPVRFFRWFLVHIHRRRNYIFRHITAVTDIVVPPVSQAKETRKIHRCHPGHWRMGRATLSV